VLVGGSVFVFLFCVEAGFGRLLKKESCVGYLFSGEMGCVCESFINVITGMVM
jgi:hypothetical protein